MGDVVSLWGFEALGLWRFVEKGRESHIEQEGSSRCGSLWLRAEGQLLDGELKWQVGG